MGITFPENKDWVFLIISVNFIVKSGRVDCHIITSCGIQKVSLFPNNLLI